MAIARDVMVMEGVDSVILNSHTNNLKTKHKKTNMSIGCDNEKYPNERKMCNRCENLTTPNGFVCLINVLAGKK